jgi:hypothetical protein
LTTAAPAEKFTPLKTLMPVAAVILPELLILPEKVETLVT